MELPNLETFSEVAKCLGVKFIMHITKFDCIEKEGVTARQHGLRYTGIWDQSRITVKETFGKIRGDRSLKNEGEGRRIGYREWNPHDDYFVTFGV
ncbi:uncharacterized protein RAG0_15019 [Rhynchosporium agropyri]|uniref:Uncharacterized protein n=1 Tax=Rhynchosporium agropyri TaxID=914238 RepID=A0A1E1LJD5_9HELO|nr:uncharacterized protein RAG0_15019 [Rhynchosporium agropyri]